jgi:hypothetical protein
VTPVTGSSAPGADRRRFTEPLAVSLLVGTMAALMFATHRAGHWWGDDWALYLRQADGLVSGNPRRVLSENEFAVLMSDGPAFSPPLYPWGFPLVLAPFVALWGTDIDRLAAVPVISAAAFACGWYLLARRRIGVVPALAGTAAITLSPLLVGWSELLQSEWTFMAVVAGALVALDRAVERGTVLTPRWSVGLGLWAAAAFTVRREGLAVVAAIAVAQMVVLPRARPTPRTVAVLAAPHLVAAAVVGGLQLLLPSTVIPRYDGTSIANLWRYRGDHVDHLLEVVGLKLPTVGGPEVFGHAGAGWVAAVVFLAAATVGVALAAGRRRDVHLAVYAVTAFVIGASFRVPVNRYVCTVAPVLLLLAATAVVDVGRRARSATAATVAVAVALGAVVAGDLADLRDRIDRAATIAASGEVEWGPTHPEAVEMFDAVVAMTDPDDLVGSPKARAMTFATGRRAVQVDEYRPIPDLPDGLRLTVVVVEFGSSVHARLLGDPTYTPVWSNPRFVVFRTFGV